MILAAMVTLIGGIVNPLVGLLPSGSWSPSFGPVASLVSEGKAFDAYIPMTEIFACIGVLLAVRSASAVYQGIQWVWRHLPVVGAS